MPSVPKYNEQVKEQGMSGAKLQGGASIEAFGGGRANQVADAIGGLSQAASGIYQKVQADADKLHDKEDANLLAGFKTDRVYGPNGVLRTVKGKAALDIPNTLRPEFDDYVNTLTKDFSEDRKMRFKERAETEWSEINRTVNIHGSTELTKHEDETFSGFISNQKRSAIESYNDNESVEKAVGEQRRAIAEYAEMRGHPSEWVQEKSAEIVSQTRSDIVKRLISDGNPLRAEAYYKQHADDFTDKDGMQTMLKSSTREYKAEIIANDLIAKGVGEDAAAYRSLEKITDPDLKSDALNKFKLKAHLIKEEQKMKVAEKKDQLLTHIIGGGSFSDAHPDQKDMLSDKEIESFKKFELQERGVLPKKTDITVWSKFDNMPPDHLAKVDYGQILDARMSLTNDQYNQVRQRYTLASNAAKGDPEAKARIADDGEKSDMLFKAMQDFKVAGANRDTVKGKKNDEQDLAYQKMQQEMEDWSLDYEKSNSGKKPSPDVVKSKAYEIARRVGSVEVKGEYYGTNLKKIADLDESDKQKALVPYDQIPERDLIQSINVLRSNGLANGLRNDEIMSAIKNGAPLGKLFKERIERAQGQKQIGDMNAYKQRLLGK